MNLENRSDLSSQDPHKNIQGIKKTFGNTVDVHPCRNIKGKINYRK